ncbi:hypothetical protein HRbin33_02566 [bacterium HR33]|nr:hypothetical protein HRbin33_02566 [bacterium HR33]
MEMHWSLRRISKLAAFSAAALLLGLASSAQGQDPLVRLRELVPQPLADQIVATVEEARRQGLPDRAVAARVLEGAAKGAAGEQLLAAANRTLAALQDARAALEAGGRLPGAVEIEAASQTLELGVEAQVVATLARAAPSGRSLVVPLAVLGGLVAQGVPADQALDAIGRRLELSASDREISRLPDRAAEFLAAGLDPARAGLALARERVGFDVPVSAIPVVVGPPPGIPPNAGRPGSVPKGPPPRPRPPVPHIP